MPVDPKLFGSTPFRNKTAWRDLKGTLYLWHVNLADTIAAGGFGGYPVYYIGSPAKDQAEQEIIERMHAGAAAALGIAPPPTLAGYDLDDPADFASWTWLLSLDCDRLRAEAGMA